MKEKYSDYLKFIDDALALAKAIPKYFSKFSNKIYCNHQKLAIYVLMQKFKTTTRGIVSIIKSSSEIRLHLGLNKVPVHTTIVRFVNKIKKQINKLLGIRQAVNVALDATGFDLDSKSYYYRNIVNPISNRRKRTKKFMKLSIAVDTDKQTIMTYKIRKSPCHDNKDFKILLKDLKVDYVLADKGYDSKDNRKFIFTKLRAKPIIPFRKCSGRKGFYNKKAVKIFSKKMYGKRAIVENVFFCIKRKYGSVLRNRTFATQKVELISKLIAHNVDKMQHCFLFILRVAPAHQTAKFINK